MDRMMAVKGVGAVSQFTAMAVHRYAESGGLAAHIDRVSGLLQAKRDAILAALDTHLGGRARWTTPSGGLFVFVQMLDGSDAVEASERGAENGVLFAPGPRTAADGVSGRDRMRLCFGWNRPDEMDAAIATLAGLLEPAVEAVAG